MDYSAVHGALSTAKQIVRAGGLFDHLPEYTRKTYDFEFTNDQLAVRFEFTLDPSANNWYDNYRVTVRVNYTPSKIPFELDGALLSVFDRKVTINWDHGESSVEGYRKRENLGSCVALLGDMLVSALPETVIVTLKSKEDLEQEYKQKEADEISKRVLGFFNKQALKNLRTNGKGRLYMIPATYLDKHSSYPPDGVYKFSVPDGFDRRGRVKSFKRYKMKIHNFTASCDVMFYRVE